MSVSLDIFDLPAEAVGEVNPAAERVLDEKDKKMVCLLVSLGEPIEQVARKLGVSKADVERIIHADDGIEQVIRFQQALFPDPALRVKRLANIALDRLTKILVTSSSETSIIKVGQDLLDRSLGKATQVVENRNLNVDVVDTLDADRKLRAAEERLKRLEATQKKLLAARGGK